MQDVVQLNAKVPQTLKRQAFSVMALRGLKFSPWVREQLQQLVANQQAVEQQEVLMTAGESDGQTQ